ncbi:hypothetical protein ACFLW6_03855 [Chloroflexota bacterium]
MISFRSVLPAALPAARLATLLPTLPFLTASVTLHFKDLNLNLDYSGFVALIPVRRIDNAEYTVGIYVRKGDIEALAYTNKAIKKLKGTIETE